MAVTGAQGAIYCVLLAAAVTTYVHLICRRLSNWARLLSAIPVFVVLHEAPHMFDPLTQPVLLCMCATMLWWWPSFKLLAFCFNRGSLKAASSWSNLLARFFLPIVIVDGDTSNAANGSWKSLLLRCVVKLVVFAAVISIAASDPHPFVREFC